MSMSSKNAPAPEIMNVRQIIEYAFGDFEENTVNFKLVQTVLFLIARQLRLLERRVEIELTPLHLLQSDTTLTVTEVKIHAMQKKPQPVKKPGEKPVAGKAKPGEAGTKPGVRGAKPGAGAAKPGVGGAKPASTGSPKGRKTDRSSKSSSDKTSADKSSADNTSSADKTTSSGKTTSTGEKTSTDQTSSTVKTTSTDMASGGKTTSSGEKTSTDQTSSTVKITSTDMVSGGKTTSSGEKTSIDQTSSTVKITSTDMVSGGKTTSSGEKTSTDQTSSAVKTTSTDMVSGGKTTSSGEKTSTDQTSSTVKTTSTSMTSGGKTTSSGEKTSTDQTSSTVKTTSTDMTSGGKKTSSGENISTDKTTSTDKISSRKTTSTDETSTEKTSSSRMASLSKEVVGQEQQLCDFHDNLETFEEQTEKVLRYIHQRADSVEEGKKDATPFASLSSVQEAQYEKLLVVKKVPSKEAREADSQRGKRTPPLISLVTQEQFEDLADVVRTLEKKFLPIGIPGFPEHAELMEELRRGASLTDAMAALQLSARLEATEKALAQMISMVTELVLETPGLELDSETRAYLGLPGETAQKGFDAVGISARSGAVAGGKTKSGKGTRAKGGKGISAASDVQSTTMTTSKAVETKETETRAPGVQEPVEAAQADQSRVNQYVTFLDLQAAAREVYDDLLKKVKTLTARTNTTAENAYKLSVKLESKLDSSINVSSQMSKLENAIKQYAEQVTALDTGLSSQMTNYQEQLTQMQQDLEIGLDNMAEVFGNAGGDVEAMAELHSHFTGLQVDLESMAFRQKELKDVQDSTAYDLENLWKEIEMLRDTKSDREEVADALRDKAGLGELNGLVSLQQFEAVRGDFEKRIGEAYDTFNNQEYVWQKAIDDMLKLFYEKADIVQVLSLRDDIQKHLDRMQERMQVIADIVGEPKSAILSKKVFRDTSCLACGSPAYMDVKETSKVPALPKFPSSRQPAEGAEAESRAKGGGDNRPCYPDQPIPHPRDPRSHICKRYCGGSHTVVTEGLNRAPQSLVVQPQRPFNTAPGTDGKLYMVDEETAKIPCLACNKMSIPTAVASEPAPPKQASIDSIDGTVNFSITPPARNLSYM